MLSFAIFFFFEELNDDFENPISKNKVESWKDEENNKKNATSITKQEAEILPKLQMEEKKQV